MADSGYHIAITLGVLLGISLVGGLLGSYLRIPKVTAYLLVGLALGPSLFNAIPEDHVALLDPALKLAMALVLFRLGTRFSFTRLRRQLRSAIPLSLGDALTTATLVTIGLVAVGMSFSSALLLGCLAIATAPATTILVLQEVRSEGPVTDRLQVLVALNNLICIVGFELAFVVVQRFAGNGQELALEALGQLAIDLGASLLLGLVGGVLIAYACGVISSTHWLVLLIAITTLVLGLAETTHSPYMLTFLVMGMIVANASDLADRIAEELDHTTGLLCVLFFSVHGAELDIQAALALGVAGTVYMVMRTVGKVAGTYAAARVINEPLTVRRATGPALLAQAGAAIALASLAMDRNETLGEPIMHIILGSVVVFEIAGPLLIRRSLLVAGEIPLHEAVPHHDRSAWQQWSAVWARLRRAWKKSEEAAQSAQPRGLDRKIESIVRRNVRGIPDTATFDEVVGHIVHSRDNTYPVVDEQGAVVGVIRYPLLANVMFDPHLGALVRAADLATPANTVLYDDATLEVAAEAFQKETDDCIPVVARAAPHELVGVIRRSDVMQILVRRRKK